MSFYVFLFVFATILTECSCMQLVFVNALWRHGARSSLNSFPSDPYNNQSIWPDGPGQLTQVGMRQHYKLGQYFRRTYGGILLDAMYSRKQVYVRSTDVDRTLMSAECNMAGLFPPLGNKMWNGSATNWQPLPVHTVSEKYDELLALAGTRSTEYKRIVDRIMSSKAYAQLNKDNQDFLNKLKTWTGSKENMTIYTSWSVQDPLACEKAKGLKLPNWANADVLFKLQQFAGLDMGIRYGGIDFQNRVELAPYTAGPLVSKIIENMKDKIANRTTFNFIGYSAHDTTVSSLLVTLKAFNWLSPPFAACVIIELYKDDGPAESLDSYYVKAFYKNSTAKPIPISVIGCALTCPLTELIKLTSNLVPKNLNDSNETSNPGSAVYDYMRNHYLGVILVVVMSILIITWLAIIIYVCRSRKPKDRRSKGYRPINPNDDRQSLTPYGDASVF